MFSSLFYVDVEFCIECIEKLLQVYANYRGQTLYIDRKCVSITEKTNDKSKGTTEPNSQRSDHLIRLIIRLQFIDQNKITTEEISGQFSSTNTIEDVIRYLISKFSLSVPTCNIMLRSIQSNGQKVDRSKESTTHRTLSDLAIGNNAYLYFEYCDKPMTNHDHATIWSSLSYSSLRVTIKYLRTGEAYEYLFNNDDIIGTFLSSIIKKFGLNDVDISCLELSSSQCKLDTSNLKETLVSLGIGKRYSVLDVRVVPQERSPRPTNKASNQPNYIVIKYHFAPQEITINLSEMSTVANIKRGIIDKLKMQINPILKEDDVNLVLDGKSLSEIDGNRLLSEFNSKKVSEIKAEIIMRPNVHGTNPPTRHAINDDINNSASKEEKYGGSSSVSLPLPKRSNPVGLRNLINTCFMNSALLCLGHVVPLTSFFLKTIEKEIDGHKDSNPFGNYGEVTSAYAEFIRSIWRDQSSSFSPRQIHDAIRKIAPRFSTYDQQDSHEFMTFLLNAMRNEMKEKGKNIIEKLFYGTIISVTTCLQCKQNKKASNVTSFLPVPLVPSKRSFTVHYIARQGKHQENITIQVNASGRIEHLVNEFVKLKRIYYHRLHVSPRDKTSEPFEMTKKLSEVLEHTVTICDEGYDSNCSSYIHTSHSEDKVTLIDCIREFLTLESIENTWFCKDHCRKQTYAVKQMHIDSLPPVLIIQLNRFTNENDRRHKLCTFIEFPLNELNLNDLSSDEHSCGENGIYDLIAISNHRGSIYGGHYTAYARQGINEPWYEFDDERVYKINHNNAIVSANAYLLVYLRR